MLGVGNVGRLSIGSAPRPQASTPAPQIPANALTLNGAPLLFKGQYLTFTPR